MFGRGLLPRLGAYASLALGFWLLFQAFERSSPILGVLGGAIILAGMYLMTGVWRDAFARFGGSPKVGKENRPSDNTSQDKSGRAGDAVAGDSIDGGDQGGQLPS